MIAAAVYILCALTALLCTLLLFQAWTRTRLPLLFWSALCFAGLTVSNVLLIVDLLFLRMWRESRDRLYVLFACSFWLEGAARVALLFSETPSDAHPARYLLRVAAYGLILIAIADKNLRRR